MITDKRLIQVLVALIPLTWSRQTSLRGGLFSNDVIKQRHHFRQTQHAEISEKPLDIRNYKSKMKNADIDGTGRGSRSEQYQTGNQWEPEVVIVDMNGDELGSPNVRYQVENQQEPGMETVEINGNIVNSDNGKYEVENEAAVSIRYDDPIIQIPDAIEQQVHFQKLKHQVQVQEYPDPAITRHPKVGKIKRIDGNSISNAESETSDVSKVEEKHETAVDISELEAVVENKNVEEPPVTNTNISEAPLTANDAENEVDTSSYDVCQTVECSKLAQEFLGSMNKSVDPCEDFYEFACGGWESTNPRPPYEAVWSRNSMVEYSTNRRIKAILEAKSKFDEIKPMRQVKEWYRSCINTERREQRGVEPIVSIMLQIGGWPMIMSHGEWLENEYTWQRVQRYYARLTGSYTFYHIWANHPSEDHEFGDIIIEEPKLFDEDDILSLILEKNDSVHFSTIIRVAEMFIEYNRASVPMKRLLRESQELVLFHKALVKLIAKKAPEFSTSIEDLNDWYNSNRTNSESGSPESEINLISVIEDLFQFANITVRPSTNIFISKPEYVKGIGDLLKRTSPRIIVNYIHWKFFQKVWLFSNEKTRRVFSKRLLWPLLGLSGKVPRWLDCVKEIKMKHAISYAYVKRYYKKKTTKNWRVEKMIENIRDGLEKKIDNSNWMDSESKNLTKKKLKSIKNFVGFPEWYTNDTAIVYYYQGLEIGSEYLENHLSYMRFERKRNLENYLIPAPEETPFSAETATPITVNAFFDQSGNSAEYPAANFQPPFFGIDYPNSVNYGISGMLIGHEIGHGFDNCGITHGEDGEKTQLNEMILRSYYERVDCFVDQYDRYNGNPRVEDGTKWDCNNDSGDNNKSDGQRTAGENIADSTGLEAVFQAYKKLIKDKYAHGEKRLPGLEELTDDQLFFLSYAESWCEIKTPQYKRYIKETDDVHSIGKLRVIGPVSNTIGFAKAFNCPIGSPMNPVNKCSVWNKPGAKMNQVTNNKNRHSWHKNWDI